MTRVIEQRGEPFNPYGVQFWANDKNAVKTALNYIRGVVEETRPENYTIRLRDDQQDANTISQMSFGAALEAMKVGKTVTRPCFTAYDGIMLTDSLIMFAKKGTPVQLYTPSCEDLLAMDWEIVI